MQLYYFFGSRQHIKLEQDKEYAPITTAVVFMFLLCIKIKNNIVINQIYGIFFKIQIFLNFFFFIFICLFSPILLLRKRS